MLSDKDMVQPPTQKMAKAQEVVVSYTHTARGNQAITYDNATCAQVHLTVESPLPEMASGCYSFSVPYFHPETAALLHSCPANRKKKVACKMVTWTLPTDMPLAVQAPRELRAHAHKCKSLRADGA